jgi:hypothetical protein
MKNSYSVNFVLLILIISIVALEALEISMSQV